MKGRIFLEDGSFCSFFSSSLAFYLIDKQVIVLGVRCVFGKRLKKIQIRGHFLVPLGIWLYKYDTKQYQACS